MVGAISTIAGLVTTNNSTHDKAQMTQQSSFYHKKKRDVKLMLFLILRSYSDIFFDVYKNNFFKFCLAFKNC